MFAKSTSNALPSSHNGVTFVVDDVVTARRPVWSETLGPSLARRFCREILLLPESNKPVINSAMDSLSPGVRAHFPEGIGNRCHPLIDAVQTAFSQHYPLTISPDAIWLVIAQGFSHHIAENAEALRHRVGGEFIKSRGNGRLAPANPTVLLLAIRILIGNVGPPESGRVK
jgi:hypothetical protein